MSVSGAVHQGVMMVCMRVNECRWCCAPGCYTVMMVCMRVNECRWCCAPGCDDSDDGVYESEWVSVVLCTRV